MKTKTPFLPGISAKFYGRHKRRQLEELRKIRENTLANSITDLGVLFSDVLPVEWLEKTATDVRKRTFTQVLVFWAWTSQILEQNESCARSLTLIQNWYCKAGLKLPVFDTSGYCKARKRLPMEFLDAIEEKVSSHANARVEDHHLWYGHRLKAIDGTSVKLMDTVENQKAYAQPSSQKKGCGFPKMGVVGVLDLAQGTLCDFITCKWQQHDIKGLYQLFSSFNPGDVVIGDRAFCSYELFALLKKYEVDSVMRVHQRRDAKTDWRKGKKLGPNSRLVEWKKPPKPGKSGLSQSEWEALPETMSIRLVKVKGKTRDGKENVMYLATTLLDAEQYPSEEIALLYAERWQIEVKFRDIKTTMNLEILRVKTPEMARLSMRMIQIVYNLIKSKQAGAIQGEAIQLDEIGFKGTLDVINENRSRFHDLANRPQLLARENKKLDARLRERIILIRPFRQEPRAIKTRPKPYQYLTRSRKEFVEIQHKSRYRKAA